ncbi:hypothetical protein QBC32DRAFT_340081 [Pseudoneurospora amorphoporcata]|uniref:Rhodopsin domain-containing protein n=1 Tax=Pseudoneurospora amorphoporcata TaxID=241081 RepID=A0AAN6SHB5_9PEZI|nr:hypothetical protein QBC32DRAFT_340081 [Pseudoneurospora amorphoporcata]
MEQRQLEVVVAIWSMTLLSLSFMFLRLYTRIRIVKFIGTEDYVYVLTGLFLLLFAIFLHVSVHYGMGASLWSLSLDNTSRSIFWSYVANTFAITGNAMAKLSMGFFLLRVVQLRGQKMALWVLIVVTAGTSFALVVMLWNQTTPRKASWDPLRTPGKWHIKIQPMSVGLGVWSSVCDFIFAIFPWLFIWSLRMPRREKIMLASGMSLGVIAGACGITRTVVLSHLNIWDYTYNFAPYFIWAGAEIAVAMVCLGIPTLRPLYLRRRGLTEDHDELPPNRNKLEMPDFTMVEQHKQEQQQNQLGDHKLPTTSGSHSKGERSPSPPPPAYVRDSASSHTVADMDSLGDVETFQTPLSPASMQKKSRRGRNDSVDDILGLYDAERSRSRGTARSQGTRSTMSAHESSSTTHITALKSLTSTTISLTEFNAAKTAGAIMVKNEIWIGVERDEENWPLRC